MRRSLSIPTLQEILRSLVTQYPAPGDGGKLWGAEVSYALVPFSSTSHPCSPALEKSCLQQPLDCDDIYAQGYQADGVYLIYPLGPSVPVPVFCDMTTEGGKWTVSEWRGTEAILVPVYDQASPLGVFVHL